MTDGSQYGEATFILEHFAGRTGRFLDIGAFDGITLSNTRPLADLGWSGVCVEPSPPAFCQLMINYAGNERIQLVHGAIGSPGYPRLCKLHCNTLDAISADTMSTFDTKLRDRWADHGYPFRDIWVPQFSWDELFSTLAATFTFVNIDVEGMNADVLSHMPFLPFPPEMICVENDPRDLIPDLVSNRYPNTRVIGGNVLGWK